MLEMVEKQIEVAIVAAILDPAAGMGGGRPIAPEMPSDGGKAETESDMGQVHGDLAGKRHRRPLAGRGAQIGNGDVEGAGDGFLSQSHLGGALEVGSTVETDAGNV